MTVRSPSRLLLGVVTFVLAFAVAAPARGAVLWTLTASPLTVQTGVQTTFQLRATLTVLGEIRCVVVGVPANFSVHGAAVVGSNAGTSWIREVSGNTVRVRPTSGGDRLRTIGQYVDFTITATANAAGSLAWTSNAYADGNCNGAGSLLGVPPVVLVVGPALTPTPVPTVAPTPTPAPTVAPTRTPRPSAPAVATPRPTQPTGTPEPAVPPTTGATPTPTPTPEPSRSTGINADETSTPAPTPPDDATPSTGGQAGEASPPDSRGSGLLAEPAVPVDGQAMPPVPIELGALGLAASIDTWIVPGLLLGVPGMLVVAFVLLQAIGALAWIPAIRRLRGDDRPAVTAAR